MRRRLPVLAALMAGLMGCAQGSTVTPDLAPDLEAGRQVFSASCATCHGGNGEGGSAPALADVLTTFSDCGDHIRWVSMGSERHKAEVGPTYGDTGKEITAIMPEFGASLSDTEIAQVAAFERHRFAGADEATALADCGL